MSVGAAGYDTFEQMHYICFHYEFEHRGFDVDESCGLAGCPSAAHGSGKQAVIATARSLAIAAVADEPSTNSTLHEYLEALAGWLEDSDGYYLNVVGRRTPPQNGWEVFNDALQATATYE
ncbi:DUF7660 family protein [Promicromonospora soli]|uniref:DUF7660 domain-containing protein n=1 Tax=Promicromonospora soli TaxID=2035533 RepID=A0A919FQ04_9MICO|nr:hypothetical protein [Promicromonospora soli]GHH70307.1 hypothetical protein GCM10017772_16690 [Promicromonospora soli]